MSNLPNDETDTDFFKGFKAEEDFDFLADPVKSLFSLLKGFLEADGGPPSHLEVFFCSPASLVLISALL